MPRVLTLNGGSSSIKLALFDGTPARRIASGKMERIGQPGTRLSMDGAGAGSGDTMASSDTRSAPEFLLDWLDSQPAMKNLDAVGHRIVHGMQHFDPQRVTDGLLRELGALTAFDPEHLPQELELLTAFHRRRPAVPQVVCFDTEFHRDLPRVAQQLPIPRRYWVAGLRRYGFHGISYTYLMSELHRLGDPAARRGRVILAHLGNGASMAAVLDGACIDTSMSFTPTAGLVMGTRSGDLDPGVMNYLMREESLDARALSRLTNHDSGLAGISESSADVRDLLQRETQDERAADALALFCYQARKWIGAYAAALGGVDTLVFAGGIGENAAPIRERICAGLEHLGIALDSERNSAGLGAAAAASISTSGARATVRIIKTDEESVIAARTVAVLTLA